MSEKRPGGPYSQEAIDALLDRGRELTMALDEIWAALAEKVAERYEGTETDDGDTAALAALEVQRHEHRRASS